MHTCREMGSFLNALQPYLFINDRSLMFEVTCTRENGLFGSRSELFMQYMTVLWCLQMLQMDS